MNKIFTQKCDKIVGECIKSLSNLSTKNDCFSCLHYYCLDNLVCLNKEQRDYCLLQLEDYVRNQDLKNLEEADKLKKELDVLIKDCNRVPTSDLQGCCLVLAKKFGVSEDDLLEYIYERVEW
jgi:hypothetical protein